MSPQNVDKPGYQDRRVVPFTPRTIAAARETIDTTARDWVSWACLALGILCGAGAVFYALKAMAE